MAIQLNDNSDREKHERLLPLGRAFFGIGIALLILRGLEVNSRMPGFPTFWYANQPLWIAIGIGLTGLGWQIVWRSPQYSTQTWRPNVPGRRFQSLTLYVSEGCHLCDDAAAMLEAYQQWLPAVEEIDIQSDPALVEKFKTCVPVVAFDGKVRFRGKIDEMLLRRLIEGTRPNGPN